MDVPAADNEFSSKKVTKGYKLLASRVEWLLRFEGNILRDTLACFWLSPRRVKRQDRTYIHTYMPVGTKAD